MYNVHVYMYNHYNVDVLYNVYTFMAVNQKCYLTCTCHVHAWQNENSDSNWIIEW